MTSPLGRVPVTGANRGFGAACAQVFSENDWDVVGTSRNLQPAEAVRDCAVHPGSLTTGIARPDARDDPLAAARKLFEFVDAGDLSTATFLSLEGGEIAW